MSRELDAAGITEPALRASYTRCRELNAVHGRTYFLATRLLPPAARPAIHALYGLARFADEIVDDLSDTRPWPQRLAQLDTLTQQLRDGLERGHSDHPVLAAPVHTAIRYRINPQHFTDFMVSMRMDRPVEQGGLAGYRTFDELARYVHGSAAVIGLQVLPVLGTVVARERAEPHAAALGIAFQITNFLRDVGEDLDRGRVYLPADELAAFGVDRELLVRCRSTGRSDPRVRRALAYLVARTRAIYRRAAPGIPMLAPVSRACVATAFRLYSGILDEIEAASYHILSHRVTVPLHRRLAVALPGLSRALVARTGGVVSPVGDAGVLRAQGVSREVPRDAPVEQTVEGLTKFGRDLYTVAADPARNAVLSPLSIGYAFGMARAGAGGQTASQLDRVFGFPASGPHAAFNTLDRQIGTVGQPPPRQTPGATRAPGQPPGPPVVAIANGLFIQDGLPVTDGFLRTLALHYGAGARTINFPSGQGAEQINAWVREQTAQRITKLFDHLGPATRLVLANAVYLKADWRIPFAKNPTADATFTRADGTTVAVPMMHQQESLRYASGQGWQAVELPYAASELAMRVIVPQGTLTPATLLSPGTLTQVHTGLRTEQVDLFLPRWNFATDLDLLPALNTLGLTALDDFSGMSPERLPLGQAMHRANIMVDEWGTEAAAVTGLAFVASLSFPPQPPLVVRADRPFAFAIVHQPTGAPLFIGHVADPLAE